MIRNKVLAGLFLGAAITMSTPAGAVNFNVFDLPLGSSMKVLLDTLAAKEFVFTKVSDDSVEGAKLVLLSPRPLTELPAIVSSAQIKLSLCAGKVYRIELTSVDEMNIETLLLNRKKVYDYVKTNGGVPKELNLHPQPTNPRVVEGYEIDRAAQRNSQVRGLESVQLTLEFHPSLTRMIPDVSGRQVTEKVLQMTYRIENRWFCPS
jgi:hypothetical protein